MSYAWVCVHIFICVNVGTCAPCVCMGVRDEPWLSFVTFYLCCFAVEPGRLAGWPENFQGCSRPVVHLLRMVLSWKGPLSVFLVFYIESEDVNFGQMLSF